MGRTGAAKYFKETASLFFTPNLSCTFSKRIPGGKKTVQESIPFGLGIPLNEFFYFLLKIVVVSILLINFNDGD